MTLTAERGVTSSAVSQKVGDLVFSSIRRSKILVPFLGFITVSLLAAGCFNKSGKDTNTPVVPQIGVVDVNKALKSHPKYQELITLQQEYNALAAKLEAAHSLAGDSSSTEMPGLAQPEAPEINSGVNTALEQEFKTKMAGKQAELHDALNAKEAQLRESLKTELKDYSDAVDKEYGPKIFDIQLKLKTVQVSKEEMTSLQSELDRLQNERAGKIADKKRQLAAQMDRQMAAEQAAAEQQLKQYSEQLNNEMAQKSAAASNEIMSRNQPPSQPPVQAQVPAGNRDEDEQRLAMKQHEIDALRQFILDDIRDKAGKVAAERGIETVLANVAVNASATDITDAVIASFAPAAARL